MIVALTRDMPAIFFANYGWNAHLCASAARVQPATNRVFRLLTQME
jgi:hypothetical protein